MSHGAWIATLIYLGLIDRLGYDCPQLETDGGKAMRVLNTSVTIIELDRDGAGSIPTYADINHLLKPAVKSNADDVNEEPPQATEGTSAAEMKASK